MGIPVNTTGAIQREITKSIGYVCITFNTSHYYISSQPFSKVPSLTIRERFYIITALSQNLTKMPLSPIRNNADGFFYFMKLPFLQPPGPPYLVT